MAGILNWFKQKLKSKTNSVTKDYVRRGTSDMVFVRIKVTGVTMPSQIKVGRHSVTPTEIVSKENFLLLLDDALAEIPADPTGATLEAYYNTDLKEVIVFGLGSPNIPKIIYRFGMTKDVL